MDGDCSGSGESCCCVCVITIHVIVLIYKAICVSLCSCVVCCVCSWFTKLLRFCTLKKMKKIRCE